MSRFARIYVRAPNHLGDGVMAMPALRALRAAADEVVVAAPRWGAELYRDLDVSTVARGVVPDADVGVLFAPSFRAAWEARHLPRRVGLKADFRRLLLTDAVTPPGRHRGEDYAAVIGALGLTLDGPPRFEVRDDERAAVDVPADHLALNPLSPSGPPVMWSGFEDLAAQSPLPVVFYAGPGERLETRHPTRIGQPLGLLGASLLQARVLVSNDSGLAHFARAVGVPTVVLFGSTAPSITGPEGSFSVVGPDPGCRPCYRKQCPYQREAQVPCLEISPAQVLTAALEAGAEAQP